MQSVSAAFQTALLSRNVTITKHIEISLVDNTSIGASISPNANVLDSSLTPASRAINGILAPDHQWAIADPVDTIGFANGARCFPDVSYPMDTTSEAGWWGNTLSDGSGNYGVAQTYTLTYSTPISISQVAWYADTYLGYPVNFVISYDLTGAGLFTTLVTVTGNASPSWLYNLNSNTLIYALKISITKINQNFAYPKLIEFQGGLIVDVTNSVRSLSLLRERSSETATLQVGNSTAGSLDLSLDNTLSQWSPHNVSSVYRNYLRSNRRIKVQLGVVYDNGTTELIPSGTYYSMIWNAHVTDPIAAVKARDRMKRLQEFSYTTCPLSVNQTIDTIIKLALNAAGFGVNEYYVNPSTTTIPYAFCSPTTSFYSYISQLAAAVGGFCYFDETGRFHFEDNLYLSNTNTSSVITLTDNDSIFSSDDIWDEGDVKNTITVTVNALQAQTAGIIWSLQENIVIASGNQITINLFFQSPSTAVTTPTITSSGGTLVTTSWTVYAQGATLVLTNTGGSTCTITAMTVTGQALQTNGSTVVQAINSAKVASEGTRDFPINNPYIQTRAAAATLANTTLAIYQDPPAKLHIDTVGLPHIQLGDRITVNSAVAGINADFWVIRHIITVGEAELLSGLDVVAVYTNPIPSDATIWFDESLQTVGSGYAPVVTSTPYNITNAMIGNGYTITHSVFVQSGVYVLNIMLNKDTNKGLLDIYVDNVLSSSANDMYAASTTLATLAIPITLSGDGDHLLTFTINGKNASSTNYGASLVKAWLYKVSN